MLYIFSNLSSYLLKIETYLFDWSFLCLHNDNKKKIFPLPHNLLHTALYTRTFCTAYSFLAANSTKIFAKRNKTFILISENYFFGSFVHDSWHVCYFRCKKLHHMRLYLDEIDRESTIYEKFTDLL